MLTAKLQSEIEPQFGEPTGILEWKLVGGMKQLSMKLNKVPVQGDSIMQACGHTFPIEIKKGGTSHLMLNEHQGDLVPDCAPLDNVRVVVNGQIILSGNFVEKN